MQKIIIVCKGWKFASQIQGFFCICSNEINLNENAICLWECVGNGNENCGGPHTIANVFHIGTQVVNYYRISVKFNSLGRHQYVYVVIIAYKIW